MTKPKIRIECEYCGDRADMWTNEGTAICTSEDCLIAYTEDYGLASVISADEHEAEGICESCGEEADDCECEDTDKK